MITQAIPSIDDRAVKKVHSNITKTELFIEFKIIAVHVPACIINRKRYIA